MDEGPPTAPLPAAGIAGDMERWLETFPRDLDSLREALLDRAVPPAARRVLVGALGYWMRQMDLIPDHERPLGLADDCMVARVAADLFMRHNVERLPLPILQKMGRLAAGAEQVKAFLGDDLYQALDAYVGHLPDTPAKGYPAQAVIDDEVERGRFFREIEASLARWKPGAIGDAAEFERDLRNYLAAKLDVQPA